MSAIERLYKAVKAHGNLSDSNLEDAANYGADSGFAGFTYNQDGADFYTENEDDIYELLQDDCDQLGHKNIEEMISQFGRSDMLDSPITRKCLLAWYALEKVGQWVIERSERMADNYQWN
jgi:hypothetical protein